MTTAPAKLYGKNLSEYDDLDVDQLLSQLSPEEISILAKEVDPDVSIIIVIRARIIVLTLMSKRLAVCLDTSSLCHSSLSVSDDSFLDDTCGQ